MAGISAPELIIRSLDRDRNRCRDGRWRLFSLVRKQCLLVETRTSGMGRGCAKKRGPISIWGVIEPFPHPK